MSSMTFSAQPTNLQRLQVVLMVPFGRSNSTLFAWLWDQYAHFNSGCYQFMSGFLKFGLWFFLMPACCFSVSISQFIYATLGKRRLPSRVPDRHASLANVTDTIGASTVLRELAQRFRLFAVRAKAGLAHAGEPFLSRLLTVSAAPLLTTFVGGHADLQNRHHFDNVYMVEVQPSVST